MVKWKVWSSVGQGVREMVKRITGLYFQVSSEGCWHLLAPGTRRKVMVRDRWKPA